jgi:hypothetical protein
MPSPKPEIQLTAAEMALVDLQSRFTPVPDEVLTATARIRRCYSQCIEPSIIIPISKKHVRMLSIGDLKIVSDFIESQNNARPEDPASAD